MDRRATVVLACLPVCQIQTPTSHFFIRSCAVLAGTIRTFGVYETTRVQEKLRRKSIEVVESTPREHVGAGDELSGAVSYRFKSAYENFELLSKHVNSFSQAWSVYFFFAEVPLLFVFGFCCATPTLAISICFPV